MTWKITQSTDNQHVGETVEVLEIGNIITFPDGDVVAINQLLFNDDNTVAIVVSPNYQVTFVKE